jgi:hypothetical protein
MRLGMQMAKVNHIWVHLLRTSKCKRESVLDKRKIFNPKLSRYKNRIARLSNSNPL